jgi:hypothetical protein
MKTGTKNVYADLLIREWQIPEQLHNLVHRVLCEMDAETLLTLRNEPRLEVMVRPDAPFAVWPYFPVTDQRKKWSGHSRFIIKKLGLEVKPETQALLLFSDHMPVTEDQLRDDLGHMLLYLRDPKAPNECADAQREWRDVTR